MAVTLKSGIILGLIGLILSVTGYSIFSSDSDNMFGLLLCLVGLFILLTAIIGILSILFKAIFKAVIGPNTTYTQIEKNMQKTLFFWIVILITDFVGLFLGFKMESIFLILAGLLLILPLMSIMWGASAQLNALRRIRNTIISMKYTEDEAREITMDVVRLLKASRSSLTPSGAGPLVPSWTEISGVELSSVINNVLIIRKRE